MDTAQIERLLAADAYTRTVVRGVLPKDGLPTTPMTTYPAAFVCNTHSSNEPGQHWICMFIAKDGRGEYFDSYGLPPRHDEFVDFLQSNCVTWTFNKRTLQSPLSNVCGQYCVVYLLHRSRGVPTKTFVNTFGNDLVNNDCRVFDFVKSAM